MFKKQNWVTDKMSHFLIPEGYRRSINSKIDLCKVVKNFSILDNAPLWLFLIPA